MNAFFLTGTDTEIGKTFVACALLHAWRGEGFSSVGYKPVAAGADFIDGQWSNEDARRLQQASSSNFSLAEINPVCLREALAPHLAAKAENIQLSMPPLLEGFHRLQTRADRVLVEGVGGFRVPLGKDFDSADLAMTLDLPVVLVVGLRLGCINHALLSAEAIKARGLKLAGWIGNSLAQPMLRQAENMATLRNLIEAPCLGELPYIENSDPALAAPFLTLPAGGC